ncbi:hypothetical protein V2J09_006739 [Rumex salicifolius]
MVVEAAAEGRRGGERKEELEEERGKNGEAGEKEEKVMGRERRMIRPYRSAKLRSSTQSPIRINLLLKRPFLVNELEPQHLLHDRRKIYEGLGMHGRVEELFHFFDKMKESGIEPDHQTFTSVLAACSHTGRLDEGFRCFKAMVEHYKLEPKLEQYTCMVDLLGRAGYLSQAYDMIKYMPFLPDDRIWGSLLGSCRIYGDERLAKLASDSIFRLEPNSTGYRVLLANLYQDAGIKDEVTRIRSSIKDLGLRKTPGCSWIEGTFVLMHSH